MEDSVEGVVCGPLMVFLWWQPWVCWGQVVFRIEDKVVAYQALCYPDVDLFTHQITGKVAKVLKWSC